MKVTEAWDKDQKWSRMICCQRMLGEGSASFGERTMERTWRLQPGSWELQIQLLPTTFFAYLPLFALSSGLGRRGGDVPLPQLLRGLLAFPANDAEQTPPAPHGNGAQITGHLRAGSPFLLLCVSPFLTCEPWSVFQRSTSLLKCTFLKCCTA